MNDNLNTYGFGDEVYLYTWMEETRDWREHTHEHIEEVKQQIIDQVQASESTILSTITDAKDDIITSVEKTQTYLEENIYPKVEKLDNVTSTVNSIWDKIKDWTNN